MDPARLILRCSIQVVVCTFETMSNTFYLLLQPCVCWVARGHLSIIVVHIDLRQRSAVSFAFMTNMIKTMSVAKYFFSKYEVCSRIRCTRLSSPLDFMHTSFFDTLFKSNKFVLFVFVSQKWRVVCEPVHTVRDGLTLAKELVKRREATEAGSFAMPLLCQHELEHREQWHTESMHGNKMTTRTPSA